MKKCYLFILVAFLVIACGEPEPRRPVQQRSGSFFAASVARSKKILEQEQKQIQKIIANDSTTQYYSSDTGFWYYYESRGDTTGYLPTTNDVVLLSYDMMSLSGDTIYRAQDIGLVQHAVDKSQLFPGLRNGIKLMRLGEKVTFLFPSSQVYGYKGDNDKIGPNQPMRSSVVLLEIKKDSSNLNTDL